MANITEQTTTKDLSISYTKATMIGTLLPLPFILIIAPAYNFLWSFEPVNRILHGYYTAPVLLGLIIVGSVAHELIHGLTFSIAGKKPFRTIRYGFHWQTLSPYTNCTVPLDVRAYKMGGSMPFLIEGILPSIAALITGSAWLLIFGVIFILGAGGDLLIMLMIWNVEPNALVLDHPTRVGCSIFIPEKQEGGSTT